jgi:hypothetical protein
MTSEMIDEYSEEELDQRARHGWRWFGIGLSGCSAFWGLLWWALC